VIQCVSDQATALIAHAETHLGVHHSPDLFHVQQEACRATSESLNRQTEKTEKALKDAESSHQENAKKLDNFNENWPCSLTQLDLEKELSGHAPVLEKALSNARREFEATQARQRRAREARCHSQASNGHTYMKASSPNKEQLVSIWALPIPVLPH